MKPFLDFLWNLFLITSGSILCALAVNGILIPQEFLSAGFTGVTLIIYYLFPVLPPSLIYLLINIPLFFIGWNFVGRRFFVYSMLGMAIFSASLQLIHLQVPVSDKIMSAALAGIISGSGSGIILRSLGSAAGLDILSVILSKRFSLKLGTTSLMFNSLLLCFAALIFSLDAALYTLLFIYVSAQVMNLVVMGLSKRKTVLIISDAWEEISREILKKDRRGVTIIEAQGAYRGNAKHILYSVIAFQDLPQLKQLISRIDPDAFVVVTDTQEVMGRRLGNQPHW
ncbi:MAG TPA: YitT family protein [Deltaproteobacteria bacterium]|nr:YitT family protein [Deltaproteobacteria bacterium]